MGKTARPNHLQRRIPCHRDRRAFGVRRKAQRCYESSAPGRFRAHRSGIDSSEETARGAKPSKLLIEIEGFTFVISELSATSDPRFSTGFLRAIGNFGPELPLPPSPIVAPCVPFVRVWATPSHSLIENDARFTSPLRPSTLTRRHFRSRLATIKELLPALNPNSDGTRILRF